MCFHAVGGLVGSLSCSWQGRSEIQQKANQLGRIGWPARREKSDLVLLTS